jgi:phage gp36-like protein
MERTFFLLVMAFAIGTGVGVFASAQNKQEGAMAYCSIADLQAAYGEDRIAGWSRLNPGTADRAIADAAAEIDGYLLSGGYAVPLPGAPANIKKYCIDIASANLVLSAGVLESDPGGKAVLEQAKIARQYLTKVAEGKFAVPGYGAGGGEVSKPPSGGVQTRTSAKLDFRGY